ncbi:PAS domain S-box protein [Haloplanus rubicundus]|uniref:PAS domain S-box protein n=2 Tax=Haloplanus rubicundus TaxID=1547898 RepID=A0A345E1E3_9EURY|nr:PAS domain S-box protein [Haloplanus rubicundus]AXG06015.1 PAS domain S-box protein [Haloplanus rubicundus]
MERALDIGTEYLGLPVGALTRIDDGKQEIVATAGEDWGIEVGDRCPLDEAYCRRTVEMEGTLAVQDAAASPAVAERTIRAFGFGTYIGVKVTVDDETYGTVCFAAESERSAPFDETEEVFLELLGKLIGQALERRRYERELEARTERLEHEKARFEGIAETSFDILFRLDRAGAFTYVSSAVERVLGYEPAELIDTPFAAWLDGASIDDALGAFDRTVDGETVEDLELDFVDAAGERVVVAVNATPIRGDDGVVGVQGVGRDVTARKERERELRRKTRAMDEAQVGISMADADGDLPIVYANEGFERVTGYDAAEIVGRNCRFLQGEATDESTVAELGAAVDAGEPASVDLLNYRADDSPFWNQVRLSPIEGPDGDLTHYLGFQTDVTERKRTEQLVRLLNRVLRHNLRNDLNVLLGVGNHLQSGLTEDDDVSELGDRIERTANRLLGTSEQARELERYARREREPRRLDPAALFDAATNDASEGTTIDAVVRTERGICAGPELEQALTELVGNAVEHDPDAGTSVELEATDDGEWVELTVSDDGPGIDDMEAAAIDAGEETDLVHCSGLGLWLVNWIVTRYGGSFGVRERDDGAGSVACVRLPAIDDDTPVDAVARRPTVLFR